MNRLVLILCALVFCIAAGVEASANEVAYVSASALNVRSNPGTEYPVVDRLERGAAVQVLETADDWSRIERASISGWVASQFLSDTKPVQPLLSDARIRQLLIRQSLSWYSGSCPCPYNVDRGGRRCGGRSAYSRPGGASPFCYPGDVSQADVNAYRERMRE